MDSNLHSLTKRYIQTWNQHDSQKVVDLFSDQSILRDWDIEAENKINIKQANQNIFDHCPDIHCDILQIHVSESTNTTCSELIINVNDTEKIKVVDIITFDNNELITSLRAYKG